LRKDHIIDTIFKIFLSVLPALLGKLPPSKQLVHHSAICPNIHLRVIFHFLLQLWRLVLQSPARNFVQPEISEGSLGECPIYQFYHYVIPRILFHEDVVQFYVAVDYTLRLFLTILHLLESDVVVFHLYIVTDFNRKTQKILLGLDELVMYEFHGRGELQSDLEDVLFGEFVVFLSYLPQTIMLAVFVNNILSVSLVDDLFELNDIFPSFKVSFFKGFVDLLQNFMLSLLTDRVSVLFVLVYILLAGLYRPSFALYLVRSS